MEFSIPFHTLVKLDHVEDITNEKSRTLELPLQINNVTSKLESQNLSAGTYDPNTGVMFTQKTDADIKRKLHFWNYCKFCHKSNHSIPNCFRKQRKTEGRTGNSYSRTELPKTLFNQYFKAYQNQVHPNDQPSSFPVNYKWRKNYDSRNRSNSRNRYSHYRSSRLRSPSVSRRSPENSRSRYCYCDRQFNSNRTPSRSRYTDFYNQRRNFRSPYYSICLATKTMTDNFLWLGENRGRKVENITSKTFKKNSRTQR